VDVIVTDGFTGNVILKVSESLSEMVEQLLREEIKSTLKASVGFLLSRSAFRRFKSRLDYSEYGGAPLLGVKGCVIICHGRSSAKAIKNAIRFAAEFSRQRLAEKIQSSIADLQAREARAVES
jgi:phosphate acyltransferase